METIVDLIQGLGFPIAVAVASGWFIWDKDKKITEENRHRETVLHEGIRDMRKVLDTSVQAIQEASQTNKELSHTNKKLVDELSISLSRMESEICKIADILVKI